MIRCNVRLAQSMACLTFAVAACFIPFLAHATDPTTEGTWAGGFWIGERGIPYIVRITPSGQATLDRIDRIHEPEPASSIAFAHDSLRIAFPGAGGAPWEFVLHPESGKLTGILVMRNRSGAYRYHFRAAFTSMTDIESHVLAGHAGLYESEPGGRVRITADQDGTLIAHFQDDDRFQMLFPTSPARFIAGQGPTLATPAAVAATFSGETLEWTEAGATRTFHRIDESPPALALQDAGIVRGNLVLPLVHIPAGSFSMGHHVSNEEMITRLGLTVPENEVIPDQEPLRPTTLTRSFLMSRFEVTNAWFAAFVQETGYMTDAERAGFGLTWNGEGFDRSPGITWRNPGVDAPSDAPAVFVSWNDASAFTVWLTQRLEREVRLPTEAEWEYACVAGTVAMFSSGNDTLRLDEHAWSSRNATVAQPVGSKLANPWGLHDMHGNVWEWCADGYAAIDATPAIDPTGAAASRTKVLRGGSWINGPWSLRSALRAHESPTLAEPHIGFRCVVEAQH